jgi:hypothetical protein
VTHRRLIAENFVKNNASYSEILSAELDPKPEL